MRRYRTGLLAALLAVAPLADATACPNCKGAVASQETQDVADGYNRSILLMMAMPFTLLGTGAFFVVRAARRGASRSSEPGSPGPEARAIRPKRGPVRRAVRRRPFGVTFGGQSHFSLRCPSRMGSLRCGGPGRCPRRPTTALPPVEFVRTAAPEPVRSGPVRSVRRWSIDGTSDRETSSSLRWSCRLGLLRGVAIDRRSSHPLTVILAGGFGRRLACDSAILAGGFGRAISVAGPAWPGIGSYGSRKIRSSGPLCGPRVVGRSAQRTRRKDGLGTASVRRGPPTGDRCKSRPVSDFVEESPTGFGFAPSGCAPGRAVRGPGASSSTPQAPRDRAAASGRWIRDCDSNGRPLPRCRRADPPIGTPPTVIIVPGGPGSHNGSPGRQALGASGGLRRVGTARRPRHRTVGGAHPTGDDQKPIGHRSRSRPIGVCWARSSIMSRVASETAPRQSPPARSRRSGFS